jgi:DNA-binding NtrC family response regulator
MRQLPRVLIVDDRELVRSTLRNVLHSFDCAFSEAEDGTSALELISKNEFDVIFLDLKLPDRSGIEILREARRMCSTLGKVITLTGFPEPDTKAEASSLGVFRYMTKPLNWEELRSAFVEAMANSSLSSPAPTTHRDIDRTVSGTSRRRARASMAAEADRGSRPRLLVLDDNPSWLETMSQVLGTEFHLTLTTSSNEARRRASKEHFDLVVLDMRLGGGVSGLDVLSWMRKVTPDLRAIILTKHPDYETAVESGRRGALDYVSKAEVATLASTVKKVLSEKTSAVRVFLSYDRRDRAKVSRLYERLMSRGFLPWMDSKSIVGGKKWEPQIRKAIEQSDYFVFFLSRHSLYKEGVVRKEIKQALERQEGLLDESVFFIPARLEDCEVVEPFSKFQYIDLFKRDGFTKLLQAISADGKAAQ